MPTQSSKTTTFQGLYEKVATLEIDPAKIAELRSAIKRFGEIAGQPLTAILADGPSMRAAAAGASWQMAGLKKASWANILSRVTQAMELVGVNVHRRRQYMVTQPWVDLLDKIDEVSRIHLRRFAGWCSAIDVDPANVTPETFRGHLEYLMRDTALSDPRAKWQGVRSAWNRSIASLGHPYERIANDAPDAWRGLPWSAFSSNLLGEIEKYRAAALAGEMSWKLAANILAPWSRRKRLKPITVDGYLDKLRQHASRLVESGAPISRFDSLSAFVDVDLVDKGLALIQGDREQDLAAPSLHALMTAVLSVAAFLKIGGDQLATLKGMARTVRHRPEGMCERNKSRLAPFIDKREPMDKLMGLPLKIAERLQKVTSPKCRDALAMQIAVLLEILLHSPLRIKNAAALDLSKHFQLPAGGKPGPCRLSLPKSEVKNGKAIDALLEEDSTALILEYFSKFRPALQPDQSSALFINRSGQPKSAPVLARQFKNFIRRELGLTVNAHLMRHLMAFAYLEENPGEYEGVRQFLGHKQRDTTERFYAGDAGNMAAHKRLHRLIDRSRNPAEFVTEVEEL
jgi:site-specific recombinase XerC